MLIPRLHIGGMGNVSGGTSYAYARGLWTVNFGRFFTEVFGGGAIHDGPLTSPDPMPHNQPALGCRELYHIGGNVGYRFDQNWSTMVTVDHISNGRGVLSNCPENTGLSLVGLRIGYSLRPPKACGLRNVRKKTPPGFRRAEQTGANFGIITCAIVRSAVGSWQSHLHPSPLKRPPALRPSLAPRLLGSLGQQPPIRQSVDEPWSASHHRPEHPHKSTERNG
jgi:hypothetical protein